MDRTYAVLRPAKPALARPATAWQMTMRLVGLAFGVRS